MRDLALLCLMTFSTGLNAQFSWVQRADLPVSGLYGAASFVIGNYGYVVSGNQSGTDVSSVWMYDMENDLWIARSPIPQARRFGAGFAIGGKGYVSCGTVGGSDKLNDLWEYDPISDSWSSKADFPGQARYGTCSFTLGGLGYVGTGNVGSSSGPYVSDLYAYDPDVDSWSAKASMPGLSRYGTSTITAAGRAYVFGGFMSDQEHTGDIYEYDPVADSWLLRNPLPGSTRTYAMALSYANDGVIAAGKSGAGVNIYDGFFYLPSNNLWSPIPTFPGESGWVGSTMAINGRSFGGLGFTLADQQTHNDWWELVKFSEDWILELGNGAHGTLVIAPDPITPGATFRLDPEQLAQFGSPVSVMIHSILGEAVYVGAFSTGGILTCPKLAQGAYVMRLRDKEGLSMAGKFMVTSEN